MLSLMSTKEYMKRVNYILYLNIALEVDLVINLIHFNKAINYLQFFREKGFS